MDELAKLLATRRDVRVAVIGPAEVVSKYIGETEKNLRREVGDVEGGGGIVFFDEADALFGTRTQDLDRYDRPVVLGVRSIRSIPRHVRRGLVVVRAPREPRWRRLLRRERA